MSEQQRPEYAHDIPVLEELPRDPIGDSPEAIRILVTQGQRAYDQHVRRRRLAADVTKDL